MISMINVVRNVPRTSQVGGLAPLVVCGAPYLRLNLPDPFEWRSGSRYLAEIHGIAMHLLLHLQCSGNVSTYCTWYLVSHVKPHGS